MLISPQERIYKEKLTNDGRVVYALNVVHVVHLWFMWFNCAEKDIPQVTK